MNNPYKFFMSRYINGEWEEDTSLEDYFNGMKYMSCSGLGTRGKTKNIYTENYAETEELRVFLPEQTVRENTDIEFEFVFTGEKRRDIYDNFCDWITGHRLRYWDNCRFRQVEMILIEEIDVDDDELYGSDPSILAKFKFKNLKGQSEKKV